MGLIEETIGFISLCRAMGSPYLYACASIRLQPGEIEPAMAEGK